ncbi:hypothetical protein V8G54_029534 [Vigna mungo]|uniref:Uncharacterized protein n=1 Tax=Vigna mungo TaxID=3915 RepID=A0AAQ3RJ92_VIGMU
MSNPTTVAHPAVSDGAIGLGAPSIPVWDLSACSMPFQAALAKDPGVSVNRVIWSPDGALFGKSFLILRDCCDHGGDEVRQHLEIDAHVGGVNDLAFSHPNKQLCVITCAKQYTFEGHEAPVYSVCPHYKENIQVHADFDTQWENADGKIKAWLYDNLGSRVDYDNLKSFGGYGSPMQSYGRMYDSLYFDDWGYGIGRPSRADWRYRPYWILGITWNFYIPVLFLFTILVFGLLKYCGWDVPITTLMSETHELGGSAVVVDRATPKARRNCEDDLVYCLVVEVKEMLVKGFGMKYLLFRYI